MTGHPILELAARWRRSAADLEEFGANEQADVLRTCARQLAALMEEKISPAEAAKEAPHLAEQTIRNRLSSGETQNWGAPGKPLVRRGDLWGVPIEGPRSVDPAVRRRIAGGR